MKEYEEWRARVSDAALLCELCDMAGDGARIEDAFYKELEFGTGGLRGIIGAGTNRMNIYTVGRASRGVSAYLGKIGGRRIAIGYDTRRESRRFAETAARIFASDGICVYMYSSPYPTPMLSYAARALSADAGVMITASHNPAEYNGYKVYGADGCQITDAVADSIYSEISALDYFDEASRQSFEELHSEGKIRYIPDSVYSDFISCVRGTSQLFGDAASKDIKIVYTALNGTGTHPVQRILTEMGYKNLIFVPEQTVPDENFTTCPYPNPEIPEALTLGLEYARRCGAELLIATDVDCDRVGVAVRDGDAYVHLTGNELGLILLDYILTQREKHGKMPHAPTVVKTVVTTDLSARICAAHGVAIREVLTGFKYIGEQIGMLDGEGRSSDFIFGFEESCGYLGGSYVRDKDGVFASMLVAEAAAYYSARGLTLLDRLAEIYREHGYIKNSLTSYTFGGKDGFLKMREIMDSWRAGVPDLGEARVIGTVDYLTGVDGLPPANVLKLVLQGGSTVVLRPSGTEPKIKLYISASAPDAQSADVLQRRLLASAEQLIK